MMFSIIGMVIGALILGAGIYYFAKDKNNPESRQIYGIIGGVGAIIFIGTLVKLLIKIL